jgi:hypothetical protein
MGRAGVARLRSNDAVAVVSSADGEHGHRRSRAGAAEVQHWDVASNPI